ncbi:L,D-transpeptidase family protein [Asinibacterium sp. OR53]|uniref:L,D-transpeptidase family protein n=1 Tax=Asinibacterium sp. OR53 TaxID=925409 RepID=UPI0004ACC492|nr:L,D-transpeptidase family protein [Asinibacterium sp. OR53]
MKFRLTICIILLLSYTSYSQITPDRLRNFVSNGKNTPGSITPYPVEIITFYEKLGFKTAWIQQENKENLIFLLTVLKQSANWGLLDEDYATGFLEEFCNGHLSLQNADDSMKREIRISGIAIHFYRSIAFGNIIPQLGYDGLEYEPACYDIPVLLANAIETKSMPLLKEQLNPPLIEVNTLENKIKQLNARMSESDFKEVVIVSNKVNSSNTALILKLYQLAILDSVNIHLSDNSLKKAIREAQRQFNLMSDGVLRSTILEQLNVSLYKRLQQLSLSVNYYRWLYCLIRDQTVIVVNIPAAYMNVYRGNRSILEMRMVLGKVSTPTPTLASRISKVILYPYWHVPFSIVAKELLPLIKANPAFVGAGNFQILNSAGKIINPYNIKWQDLSIKHFPYTIRQSTGCDNALGLLKLDFYSPFGVYLHDTPFKNAFMLNKRYFSHGCLRMESPMKLGHLVLEAHPLAIDTLEQKGCLKNRSPITVSADNPMPVIVWYNPAGCDSTGRVLFYEDIYGKFHLKEGKSAKN